MREFDLGIVGGGQLARMTVERAAKLGFRSMVLDPAEDCPAAEVAAGFLCAGFDDREALRELAGRSGVTTLDLEAPDARALADLERRGHRVLPTPATLAVLQDKWRQRRYFDALGFPVPRYFESSHPTPADAERLGFPCVQKARRGGYDGRGVVVMRHRDDLADLLPVPSVFEECVAIEREISVLVVRGLDGDTRAYPAVETIFDARLNLIEGTLFPARLDPTTAERARRLALGAVEALGGVGLFAVEMFAGPRGALWLNEIAPRPHNSGHLTIEASRTCQFEQHVRAVLGLPLGDPGTVSPAAMVNLTGPEGGEGPIHLPASPPPSRFRARGCTSTASRASGRVARWGTSPCSIRRQRRRWSGRARPARGSPCGRGRRHEPDRDRDGERLRPARHAGGGRPARRAGGAVRDVDRLRPPHAAPHVRLRRVCGGARHRRDRRRRRGAAHLPGMIASLTALPVIGVPIAATKLDGMDALLSIAQMPAGVPVATVAIDNARNAALLAARIVGVADADVRRRLHEHREGMRRSVEERAAALERRGVSAPPAVPASRARRSAPGG